MPYLVSTWPINILMVLSSSPLGRANVLGAIKEKITVNANDDSYNQTRQRMNDVKNQSQKSRLIQLCSYIYMYINYMK